MAEKYLTIQMPDALLIGKEVVLWGGVKAMVTAVMIEKNRVSYRVSWWSSNTLHQEWIDQVLIKFDRERDFAEIGKP